MKEIEYITVKDINRRIRLRKDTGFIYEKKEEYETYRVYFLEQFGSLENYMKNAVELIDLKEFPIKTREIMRKDNYDGKYVNKIVLENGKVISQYYTLIGINEKKELNLIPTKIPLENIFTVNPRHIISASWYYLESDENTEQIHIRDIIEWI